MSKNVFLCFILCCFLNACILNDTEKDPSEKVKNLQKKSSENQDSTYIYLQLASKIIELNPVKDSLKAENDYLLGKFFRAKGDIDSAAYYHHKATDLVKDSIKHYREVDYFFDTWNTYIDEGKYGDCISTANILKGKLKANDYGNLATLYYMYENTYKASKDYEKALEYNKLQVKTLEKIEGADAYVRSALIPRAQYNYNKGDIKKSYKILDSLISLEDKLNLNTLYNIYNEYGIHRFYDKNYKGALESYLKGLESLKKMPDGDFKNNELVGTYTNISGAYLEMEKYRLASFYLDSASRFDLNKIRSSNQRNILKQKFEFASLTNKDFSEVYNYLDSVYSYQEEKYLDKYSGELVALKKANEKEKQILAEKKDLEIKSLKRIFILFGVIILVIVISVFVYNQRTHRFEKLNIQMQQRLLRSQMNPHFTFNTLYAIQNEIKESPEEASNYLLKFSRLLRLILENSTQNYVQLNEELEALKKYIELQKLRFPNKFDFEIELQDIEEDDLIFIPPMLMQPMIENSIEHGFAGIDYHGKIKLTLSMQQDFIACTVEDNGKGLSSKSNEIKKSTSTLLINNYLKKTTKKGIEIQNKKSIGTESGVVIKFKFPYKLTEND